MLLLKQKQGTLYFINARYKISDRTDFDRIVAMVDRKELAKHFLTCQNHSILFSLLDGKDYSDYIWRSIKPVYEKHFMQDES